MADLSLTGVTVTIDSGPSSVQIQQLGDAVAKCVVPVYMTPTDRLYHPANAGTADPVNFVQAMAVFLGAANDWTFLVTDGQFRFSSAILTAGATYYLSHNTGNICPFTDLVSGDKVVQLFDAVDTARFVIRVNNSIILP